MTRLALTWRGQPIEVELRNGDNDLSLLDGSCDACGSHWSACTCIPDATTDREREIARMLRCGRLTDAEEAELVRLLEDGST